MKVAQWKDEREEKIMGLLRRSKLMVGDPPSREQLVAIENYIVDHLA